MKSRFTTILALSVLSFLSACSLENSGDSAIPWAAVSVYALSPDAPGLVFRLDNNLIASNVPFGSYTMYNQVENNNTSLQVKAVNSDEAILDTMILTHQANYYSVFLIDSFQKMKTLVLNDNLLAERQDTIGIRLLTFSPDAPALDIKGVSERGEATIEWGNRQFLISANDSSNVFQPAKAGNYQFVVIEHDSQRTIATFPDIDLSKSGNYTVMIKGYYQSAFGGTGLQLGVRHH